MNGTGASIRFKARLLQPAKAAKGDSWAFLVLPTSASARLPTRGMTAVEGVINDHPFRAVLEPDGKKGHWLKVSRRMREGAGAGVDDLVRDHAQRTQGLDPLDNFGQATGDPCAPDPQWLRYARSREATRLLFRPVRVLQQGLPCSSCGETEHALIHH
jgi:hypothetical protein